MLAELFGFHVELIFVALAGLLAVWLFMQLLVTWVSPWMTWGPEATLVQHHHVEALDPSLAAWADDLGVRFYLVQKFERGDFACSAYFLFNRVVLVQAAFWHHGTDPVVRFTVAHELAHHELGHVTFRLIVTALRMRYWPFLWRWVNAAIERDENEANERAELHTSLQRSIMWAVSPNVVSARGGSAQ